MAEAFKLRVGYLVAELLTHADIFICLLKAAWAIAVFSLKSFADFFNYGFIGIKVNFHFILLLGLNGCFGVALTEPAPQF